MVDEEDRQDGVAVVVVSSQSSACYAVSVSFWRGCRLLRFTLVAPPRPLVFVKGLRFLLSFCFAEVSSVVVVCINCVKFQQGTPNVRNVPNKTTERGAIPVKNVTSFTCAYLHVELVAVFSVVKHIIRNLLCSAALVIYKLKRDQNFFASVWATDFDLRIDQLK